MNHLKEVILNNYIVLWLTYLDGICNTYVNLVLKIFIPNFIVTISPPSNSDIEFCINLSCIFLVINSNTRATQEMINYKLLHISQIRKVSKHLGNIKKGVMYSQGIKAFAWDTQLIWVKENCTTKLFSSLCLWITSQINMWKLNRL